MIWPSVAEERAAALHARHVPVPLAWRQNGLVLRVVFFVLTWVGALALLEFSKLLQVPDPKAVCAAMAFLAAEWLILKQRFFWTGIELALWTFAAVYFVFSLDWSGPEEILLVFAAAVGVAAFRMRNPLAGATSIALAVVYVDVKVHGGFAPVAVAIAVTLLAAFAMTREWQRPSTNHFFQANVLLIPPVGAVCAVFAWTHSVHVSIPFAVLAVVLLLLGIRYRDRVLLIATAIVVAIAAIDASEQFLHIAYEWKLIDAGLLTLAVALALSRALRGRTRGFVANPEAAKSYDEAMQILGAIHVGQPAARESTTDGFQSGGGGFGGAGASGGY
jgi:hypothetical protein